MDANCLPSSCNISRRNSLLFEYVKPWRRSHRSHSIHWRSRSFMCQDNEVYASPTSLKEPLNVGGAPTRDRSRKSACLSSSTEDVTFGRPSSIQESPISRNEQIELTPAELPKSEEKKYLFDNSDISDGTFDSTENLIDAVQATEQQNAAPPRIAVTPQSPVAAPSEQDLSLTRHSQPVPVSITTTTLQDDVVVGPVTFSNDLEPQSLTARTSRSLEQPVQEKQEVSSSGFPKPARPPPPSQMATLSKNSGTYQRVPCTDNRISEQERFGRGHVSGTNGALTVKPRTNTVYSGPVPCLRSNKNGYECSPRRQPKADGSPVHQRTGTPQQPARHGVHQPKRHPADRTGIPHSNSSQDLHSEEMAKEMVVVGTCTALYDFTSKSW
ncbi:unnamed protein product [Dibothriocephalus latus]|uniref:Uncharacterized protein n=1 Tax=Dibothriocephalus latus TaxID=60516 RepID=A0A3P6U6J5_DIBLA|nr:unnamed protein product [Dibothriocephalus latus]